MPTRRLRLLLLGATGQVGGELHELLGAHSDVRAPRRDELDLRDLAALRQCIEEVRPTVIVNAAAYTAVDRAETESELAFALNERVPRTLAEECGRLGSLLVHYSTDYVFDGAKRTPYVETDAPAPLNTYGASKLAGERAIAGGDAPFVVLRTGWVYGTRRQNFVLTIRRRIREQASLRVVKDQTGSPTWSRRIAEATDRLIASLLDEHDRSEWSGLQGVYHVAGEGETSWYDFAAAIVSSDRSEVAARSSRIVPVTSEEYNASAKRPPYSVLETTKLATAFRVTLPFWRDDLMRVSAMLNKGA